MTYNNANLVTGMVNILQTGRIGYEAIDTDC